MPDSSHVPQQMPAEPGTSQGDRRCVTSPTQNQASLEPALAHRRDLSLQPKPLPQELKAEGHFRVKSLGTCQHPPHRGLTPATSMGETQPTPAPGHGLRDHRGSQSLHRGGAHQHTSSSKETTQRIRTHHHSQVLATHLLMPKVCHLGSNPMQRGLPWTHHVVRDAGSEVTHPSTSYGCPQHCPQEQQQQQSLPFLSP